MEIMEPNYKIVNHDNINLILKQPLLHTQRIKYNCFDISSQYIVFGASSGGIYVFYRYPIKFIQLIPSQAGSIIKISISPNEKLISFATTKGVVCLLECNFIDSSKNEQICQEKIDNSVTSMIWNTECSDLYIGDAKGIIYVITLSDFIGKSVFQTQCYTLMTLDSCIVQLDWNVNNLLLVSTLTRCYICDTVKEQYRQIGQKLRDGYYGACFLNDSEPNIDLQRRHANSLDKHKFANVGSDENNLLKSQPFYQNIKIFCARPGSRIWEVKIDGTVVKTHQFKELLATLPLEIIVLNEIKDKLILKCTDVKDIVPQSLSFSPLLVICNQFLFSFHKNNLFIFDPEKSAVVLWTITDKEIATARVFKNFIYVWYIDSSIDVFSCTDIEKIILSTFIEKKYVLCAELCSRNIDYLKQIVPSSNKIHILSSLESKLRENIPDEIYNSILPLLNEISNYSNNTISPKQIFNGIFVVNNEHSTQKKLEEFLEEDNQCSSHIDTKDSTTNQIDDELDFKDMFKFYEFYQINNVVGHSGINAVLSKYKSVDDFYDFLVQLKTYITKQPDTSDCTIWCYNLMLLFINKLNIVEAISSLNFNETLNFITMAFTEINLSTDDSCECSYPLPSASEKNVLYESVGKEIIKKYLTNDYSIVKNICFKVPYMWKYVFSFNSIGDLNIAIQYDDKYVMDCFIKEFNEDDLEHLFCCYGRFRDNVCLFCGNYVTITKLNITWTYIGITLLKYFDSSVVLKYLLKFSDSISPGELETVFYQTFILATYDKSSNKKDKNLEDLKNEVFTNYSSTRLLEETTEELLLKNLNMPSSSKDANM